MIIDIIISQKYTERVSSCNVGKTPSAKSNLDMFVFTTHSKLIIGPLGYTLTSHNLLKAEKLLKRMMH